MSDKKQNMVTRALDQMNAGNWLGADASLTKAISTFPNDYGFLRLMGIAKQQQNLRNESLDFFNKALAIAPMKPDALISSGNAEMAMRNYANAFTHISKALKIDPSYAEGWSLLANLHAQNQHYNGALNAFKKSYGLKPDSIEIVSGYLNLLEQTKRTEDMGKVLAEVSLLAANHPIVRLYRGIHHFLIGNSESARAALEGLSFGDSKSNQMRLLSLLQTQYLGRAYEALGLTEKAFSQFVDAKALNRAMQNFGTENGNDFFSYLDARKNYLHAQSSPFKWPSSPQERNPVFLIGFPNTGVDMLDSFLRAHTGLSVLNEKPTVSTMFKKLGDLGRGDLSQLDRLSEESIKDAQQAYWAAVDGYRPTGLVVDKNPLNLMNAAEILRIFPGAKFILAMRDPAETMLSCFQQAFRLNFATSAFDDPSSTSKAFDSMMQIWSKSVELYQPEFIVSRYEDLLENPEQSLREIIAFLGGDWDENMFEHLKPEKQTTTINPLDFAHLSKQTTEAASAPWAQYADLMPEALEILAPWRKEFGYSD